MNILVAGGYGYIGSHVCVSLLNKGYSLVVIDNLSKSNDIVGQKINEITDKDFKFYNIDLLNLNKVKEVFEMHKFDAIMHFAGYKSVSESVDNPVMYYENNIISTLNLLKMSEQFGVEKFIFSSSATVYGDGTPPYREDSPLLKATNPYGESKAICERIIVDQSKVLKDKSFIIFRYFNPVGAHPSGLIGESINNKPNNLMPILTKIANDELSELQVYGKDYKTLDGTGIRDYIHIMDLAEGHIAAINYNKKGLYTFNLGTGKGYSVLQLINTFQKVNKVKINYSFTSRREGDVAISFADVKKSKSELNWKAEKNLEDMCKDAWNFVIKNK